MPTHLSPQSRQHETPPSLRAELIKVWLSLWRSCFDRYRPELHYMRGPGPPLRRRPHRVSSPRSSDSAALRAKAGTTGLDRPRGAIVRHNPKATSRMRQLTRTLGGLTNDLR